MAENQKNNPTGKVQDSKLSQDSSRDTEKLREGKAQGTPSNLKDTDTDMSKKNKEGKPDERKIQGDSDTRQSRDRDSSRRDGGSL